MASAEALRHTQGNGRITSGQGGLETVPIIDYRPYIETLCDIHDRVRSFSMRERLMRTQGNADNP